MNDGRQPAGSKVTDANSALRPFLKDGMCIGFGGFGLDRKPMTLVAEIADAPIRDLAIETFAGGLDVELLLASGKIARIGACHVGLDQFGLAPIFRAARQTAPLIFEEWSEFTQLAAWRAAAEKAPYAVVPMDPATDLPKVNPRMAPAPILFDRGGAFAVQAPEFDLAILHVEAAHPEGWAITSGDTYLDALLARAAAGVVISTERLMNDAELEARFSDVHLLASMVDAVVVAPNGALPGSCLPVYMIDFQAIRSYADAGAAGRSADDLAGLIRSSVARSAEKTNELR